MRGSVPGGKVRDTSTLPGGRPQLRSTMQSPPLGLSRRAERVGLGAAVAADLRHVEPARHAGAPAAGVADRLGGEDGGEAVLQPPDLALGAFAVAVGGDDHAPGPELRPGAELAERAGAACATQVAWKPPSPASARSTVAGGASRQASAEWPVMAWT